MGSQTTPTINATIVNGYDGFGGVHDNLVWCHEQGWIAYTLHNKVIIEHAKTREQFAVFSDSTSHLSTMAVSKDFRYLAVAEGKPNKQGNSLIYLYDT